MDEKFRSVEEKYFMLRGKFEAGRISRAEFETALKDLIFQDAQGRYWMLGVDTGKWHTHDGAAWVEKDPEATTANAPPSRPTSLPEMGGARRPRPSVPPPPAQTAPTKKGGGCGRNLLLGCLGLVVLIVVIAVGLFLGVRSGAITQGGVLNIVGLGPADIEVDNFRDDAISVNIVRIETVGASAPTPTPFGLRLNAFDVKTHRVQNPGKYRVEFRAVRGNADLGSCTLTVRGGDDWQFVALPERIAVNRANSPSSQGADFVIQTSSLCR